MKKVKENPYQKKNGKQESLASIIQKAMDMLHLSSELELNRFLPHKEGHIHHFTYQKLKKEHPVKLKKMIVNNIFETKPKRLPVNKRWSGLEKKNEKRFNSKTKE